MQEQSIDPRLDSFVATPIPPPLNTNAPQVRNEIQAPDDEGDEAPLPMPVPPSDTHQHATILNLLAELKRDELPRLHIDLLRSVGDLNRLEAEALIGCLRNAKAKGFSKEMTTRMVEAILTEVVRVKDTHEIDIIKSDDVLIRELTDTMSYLVEVLGLWKGPLLMLCYIVNAKSKEYLHERQQRKLQQNAERTKHNDENTFSHDGVRPVSNGKDNNNGKTDVVLLDQII
jgi:hypothetical protein